MQNRWKSIYVTVYMSLIFLTSEILLWKLGRQYYLSRDIDWVLFGVLLVALPEALFMAYQMLLKGRARVHAQQPLITALTIFGLCIAVFSSVKSVTTYLPWLAWAALMTVGYFGYIWWVTKIKLPDNHLLKVGNLLPDFSLQDHNNLRLYAEELKGTQSVIMFFRGNWCPFCVAQIEEVAKQYETLRRKGVKVILISSQPLEKSAALAERLKVPFAFLIDEKNELADEWGIASPKGLPFGFELLGYEKNVAAPTVLVTDADNRITFVDISGDYRIRPESLEFLNLLL